MDRLTYRLEDQWGNPTDSIILKPYMRYDDEKVKKTLLNRLASYEDTGLTPQEIEQMKARMPLHQWAGESPDKMSIFGVPVSKIIEWANADKQGRLVIYNEEAMLAIAKANAKVEENKLELLRIINKLAAQQSTVNINV